MNTWVETKLNLTISVIISTKEKYNINKRDLHEDMFLIIILIGTVLKKAGQQFCILPEKITDFS